HHLDEATRRIAQHLPPLTLTISGTTHWLGRNSLAVAANGAEQAGTRFVEQLAHLSSDARAGTRPIYGHVTLGRVRPVSVGAHDPFVVHEILPASCTATTVQLMKSAAHPAGATRYQTVSDIRFGG